ncbi:hypothetical protein [Acinetobacter radioresistens]
MRELENLLECAVCEPKISR